MMKHGWLAARAAAAMVIAGGAAAQRLQLPAECREQILQQCRGQTGGGIGECVRQALPKLSDQCRKAVSERAAAQQPLPPGMRELAYGSDARQRLDLIVPAGAKNAPLLLFVHGGGWAIGDKRHSAAPKAAHFTAGGWAFASVNYRLVPAATVEQQAADIAAAIAFIRANAAKEGIDAGRIVLMGHSAGAHLAALVASDPAYLAAAKVPLAAVRGVVLLDGAGYDVGAQVANTSHPGASMYQAAFGSDPARHARLSPTRHSAAPNAPNWLILPIAQRADSNAQSNALAAALKRGGSRATVVPVSGESHGSLNRGLGEAGDFATAEIDRFLARLR